MRRTAVALAAAALLLAGAVLCQVKLRSIERADPLGKELLYLPSLEMLDLVSMGNDGLAADLLYLWAIQYYSGFRVADKFLYLETVFDLITDLDPRHFDAYRIGAMIMSVESASAVEDRARAVERLYDKGLANLPESWELAEVAAWDAFLQLGNRDLALKYAQVAAERPGAPSRVQRVYGRWRESAGAWTVEDSIAYWQEVLDGATLWVDVVLAKNHLYDAWASRDAQQLDPMLAEFTRRYRRCPADWQELVGRGWLREPPRDHVGNPYLIDQEGCTLQPHKRIRWQQE